MKRIALVGATGLIGRQVLDKLLADGHQVSIMARRPVGLAHPSLTEQVAPVEAWPDLIAATKPDVAISCLGTTWKLAGKSEAAFRAVDQHLVVAAMEAARKSGARHAITVSSVGANAGTSTFYLRIKGEVEQSLGAMGFDRIDIMRPGLLRGERGKDRRFGERMGILLSPVTDAVMSIGGLRRYRSISSAVVANAIAALVSEDTSGTFVHENDAILRLGT